MFRLKIKCPFADRHMANNTTIYKTLCCRNYGRPYLPEPMQQKIKAKKARVVPQLNYLSTTPCRRMLEWRYSSTILDPGTRWDEVSGQLHTIPVYPKRKAPSIHWIWGWVGQRVCLDAVEETKIVLPLTGIRTRAVQPVARRYIDWVIPAPLLTQQDIFTLNDFN
jgi:hypothetical protein